MNAPRPAGAGRPPRGSRKVAKPHFLESAAEIPVVFDCQGSELIGMLHLPQTVRSRGMISMVAGGPQYRGGVARLVVPQPIVAAAA